MAMIAHQMQMQTTTRSCTWLRPTKSLEILITKLYARFDGSTSIFEIATNALKLTIFTWWILNWKQKERQRNGLETKHLATQDTKLVQ